MKIQQLHGQLTSTNFANLNFRDKIKQISINEKTDLDDELTKYFPYNCYLLPEGK